LKKDSMTSVCHKHRRVRTPFLIRSLVKVLVILVAVMMGRLPASAEEIYRWQDAAGVRHFSDRPPATGSFEVISSSPVVDTPPAAALPLETSPLAPVSGGVFWRIENGRSPPSYLLGTIHSADPRVLQWPAVIDDALQQASIFVMEMTLEANTFFTLGSAMMFSDDRDLADLLGPSDYQRLVDAMAAQPFPEAILRRMKPWVLMALLSQPNTGQGAFMDLRLYRQAVSQGKQVFGLESAEEQLAVFDGLPMDDQVTMLRSTLNQVEDLPRMIDQLTDTYLAGDLQAIADLARSYMQGEGTDLEQRIFRRLNDERNARMVQRMVPQVERGGAFIAVGALHLAGPTGIIQQLGERGFRLLPVQ
jgi:uncharacterized protein YbaP (TraB family)